MGIILIKFSLKKMKKLSKEIRKKDKVLSSYGSALDMNLPLVICFQMVLWVVSIKNKDSILFLNSGKSTTILFKVRRSKNRKYLRKVMIKILTSFCISEPSS